MASNSVAQAEKEWERFSMEEVAATPNLMVCDGWVLDVKQFKHDHPGGASYMERWVNRDISEVFHSDAPHKHTEYASRVLDTLRVGTLLGAQVSAGNRKKYDSMVDVTKPFLFQIAELGEHYHPWMTSQPVVRHLTIFPWVALESLSRYPWWWIWVGMPPLIAMGIYTSIMAGVGLLACAGFWAAGLLSWAILEYSLHRSVFHLETKTYGSNIFHFFAHGLHHLTPHDTTRLTFPPPFTYILAFIFWYICEAVCLGHDGFAAMFSGLVCGYVAYDTTHFLYHHTDGSGYGPVSFPRFFTKYLRYMKSHHNTHHFLNDTCNYGVSNPLLDFVFGTYMSKKDAEVVHEKAMKKSE
eukprot:TRINITY_DN58023_c0_g1_i1.p1 TRINITY_DN58023_c0_g1~~TRINITY_DN58023_c0_g1_i1.p1  ORF type:complete len:371 (+),score=133.63 TRINITY_DN58023_c0_g1_i1:55-1113(+)